MKHYIQKIKDLGFRVFTREGGNTYLYFSDADGKNVGYLENSSRGLRASTVHKPSRQVGTGFTVEVNGLTRSELEKAFAVAPEWASARDIKAVKKYASLEEFLNADNWNRGLREA